MNKDHHFGKLVGGGDIPSQFVRPVCEIGGCETVSSFLVAKKGNVNVENREELFAVFLIPELTNLEGAVCSCLAIKKGENCSTGKKEGGEKLGRNV